MFLKPIILVFIQLELSVNVHMCKDFRAVMRKVKAEASYMYVMSQLHIVHILLLFFLNAEGVT